MPPARRSDARRDRSMPPAASSRPGLIDTHMHVESSMVTPATLCRGGGAAGHDHDRAGTRTSSAMSPAWPACAGRSRPSTGLPLRCSCSRPPACPPRRGWSWRAPTSMADAIAEMLSWPEIGGVAEVMNMRGVIDRSEPRMQRIVDAGLASGKLVCGHARGLEGADLQAFVAAGISRTTRSPRATICWPSCAPASRSSCAARTITCCPASSRR